MTRDHGDEHDPARPVARAAVVYLAAPVGAPDIERVIANLRRAKRWLWALRSASSWSICAPWIPAVEAVLDSGATEHEERARGLADDLAVVERRDAIVLVGGRVTAGMELERDHAVARGLLVIDLTGMGAEPPAADALRVALATWATDRRLGGVK